MKRSMLIAAAMLASMCSVSLMAAQPDNPPSIAKAATMKIHLNVNGRTIPATLTDSPTTRDFIAQLPLTLTLEDYAGTEKIATLPRKLSLKDAPAGIDPDAGDITYYAPWGNLALFYRDFGYADGLIKLGSIDEGAKAFNVSGKVTVTITLPHK